MFNLGGNDSIMLTIWFESLSPLKFESLSPIFRRWGHGKLKLPYFPGSKIVFFFECSFPQIGVISPICAAYVSFPLMYFEDFVEDL